MVNDTPPAAMEVLTAEAASNERGDPGPSREGIVSDEPVKVAAQAAGEADVRVMMGGGAGIGSREGGNSISLFGLSKVTAQMHPSSLYFNQQHHSFRHLALTPCASLPPKAINHQALLIPLQQCPSHWSL